LRRRPASRCAGPPFCTFVTISPSPPHEITLSWPQRLNRTGAAPSNRRWGKVMGTATTTAVAVGLAAALLASAPTQAQPVSDFYRGKTLRMLIGYGPGGGYDNAKLDVGKRPDIGPPVTNIDVAAALPKTGIESFQDVRAKQYSVGASGGGSTTVRFPTALKIYAGAKFKLVRGYSGTSDILLAMERGEVDIVGAYGLPGILVSHPGWVHSGEATILYQAAVKRHRLLPNVPSLPELAQSNEGRQVLSAAASTGEIGRSILTTPGVPPERLAALRSAFQAMLKDPDFVSACEKRNLMVDAAAGEEIDEIVRETLRLPQALAETIGQMMQ